MALLGPCRPARRTAFWVQHARDRCRETRRKALICSRGAAAAASERPV